MNTNPHSISSRLRRIDKKPSTLARLDKFIDLQPLVDCIDSQCPAPKNKHGGRPHYPTEIMLRMLIIQQFFNLSDEQLEIQVLDRLSFHRFVKFAFFDDVPDSNTCRNFREKLIKNNVLDKLFAAINLQIQQAGFIARAGQIIDATFIPVPKQRNSRKENKLINEENAIPIDWSPRKRQQKDIDASWTKKNNETHFGYKQTVSIDAKYKFIRKYHCSTAKQHDSKHVDEVLDPSNTSKAVYMDRGYDGKPTYDKLKEKKYRECIQRKGKLKRTLKRNHRLSKTRVRVEHIFAAYTEMGGKLIRCIGFERAKLQMGLKACMYNLRRLSMFRAQCV